MATAALFRYNWQVRDRWLDWCEGVPAGELLQGRSGGWQGILKTVFHMVDVEYSWIRTVRGESEFTEPFERYASLAAVRDLSAEFRPYVAEYVDALDACGRAELDRRFPAPWDASERLRVEAVLEHVIVHEVHHAGQLSVWAREIGREPVSADWLGLPGSE